MKKLKYKNPKTPVLEGEEAVAFIKDMYRPMTEHEKMIQKRIHEGEHFNFLSD